MSEIQALPTCPNLTTLHRLLASEPQLIQSGRQAEVCRGYEGSLAHIETGWSGCCLPGPFWEAELPQSGQDRLVPDLRKLLGLGESILECMRVRATTPDRTTSPYEAVWLECGAY